MFLAIGVPLHHLPLGTSTHAGASPREVEVIPLHLRWSSEWRGIILRGSLDGSLSGQERVGNRWSLRRRIGE
jgi:hypothetical protein